MIRFQEEKKLRTFPNNFLWGTATASYQVEGAVREEGRGVSIWDTFSHTPGKITDNCNGDESCSQFHHYREDVALMKELGVKGYRFSLAWPRIFPRHPEKINPKGFDYYHRLIDELLKNEIQPLVTLYHWDLPQYLQDREGWVSRETVDAFERYAVSCFENLGDKVRNWITLNEPWVSSFLGYQHGIHAPGVKNRTKAFHAAHHQLLAHGKAVRRFREDSASKNGTIGIALSLYTRLPNSDKPEDREIARKTSVKGFEFFLDPLFKGSYPEEYLKEGKISLPIKSGDLETISSPLDFLGVNYYYEDRVAYDESEPKNCKLLGIPGKKTEMGWPIVPEGLYRLIKRIYGDYSLTLPLYITENGCAFKDEPVPDGTACPDPERIAYLQDHWDICLRLINEGIPLAGYFLWSFIDNFEWSYGYSKRFGIVYCDYPTQKRIPKDSFYYYQKFIAENSGTPS